MRNIFRILILVLIVFAFLILFAVLYSGGMIDVAGIRIVRATPATPIIALCILFSIYILVRKPLSLKEAIDENLLSLLVCIVLILYLGNYRTIAAGDTIPARYLPLSILREGNFDLDEFRNLHPRSAVSGIVYRGNHYVSFYPVGAPLIAVPIYLPSAIGPMPGNSRFTTDLEKLAASLLVVLSVIVLYFAVLALTSRRMALLIAAIYALGTSSFSVSSQALWQHGPSQLCLAAALYCLVRGSKEPLWTSLAGFPAALAVVCRPTDALLVIPMGLYVLFHQTRQLPGFLLCSVPPILFQALYNYYYFDNPFRTQWRVTRAEFWSTPLIEGIASILFSPARGLFIYSSIFVFSIVGVVLAWRNNGTLLFRYLSIGVVANLLLYSKFFMWWGGSTYGPRLLADLSPILCLFLCEIKMLFIKGYARIIFIVLTTFSIAAHAIGAYADDPFWNADLHIDSSSNVAWLWTDNQLINAPKRAWNATKILILGPPTTRSDPDLFAAEIKSDPNFISVRPLKRVWLTVHTTNSGKAVWLHGAMKKPGTVSFHMNWYRKGRLLGRFSIRKRLRYQVFPGDSYHYSVKLIAPDQEGSYDLEIATALTQIDSQLQRKSIRIPVRVVP